MSLAEHGRLSVADIIPPLSSEIIRQLAILQILPIVGPMFVHSKQVILMDDKLRYRCRNSRCGSRLPQPVDSSRRAFCCRGCHAQFYRKRCVVCEKDKTNPNAIICRRRPCRAELRKWPALYRYPARDGQSPTTCKVDARSAHSTGLKTRSVTGRAPLNLVGGYRFSNATEIEADLAGYIRAIEACLLRDEPVELPTVELPPLISPDPFDIPSFLDRRVTAARAPKRRGWDD